MRKSKMLSVIALAASGGAALLAWIASNMTQKEEIDEAVYEYLDNKYGKDDTDEEE